MSSGPGPPDGRVPHSHPGSVGRGQIGRWPGGWSGPKLGDYRVDVPGGQRVRALGRSQESD